MNDMRIHGYNNKYNSAKDYALGIFAGYTSMKTIQKCNKLLNRKLTKHVINKYQPQNFDTHSCIRNTFQSTGLENHGYILYDIVDARAKGLSTQEVENSLYYLFAGSNQKKNKTTSKLAKQIKSIVAGENAGFSQAEKIIMINTEKIGLAGFHEIGHAMNNQSSKILRGIQAIKGHSKVLSLAIPIAALFIDKTNNESQNRLNKAGNFIKDNVGKLTALSLLPIVVEETIATVKGQKLAKKALPKAVLKNATKFHMTSIATYALSAITCGFAAHIANQIRDKIVTSNKP